PELPRVELRRSPPSAPRGPGLRRYRRQIPLRRGGHRGLRLPPAPRRDRPLRERLHRRRTGVVGRADQEVARGARRLRLLRQRRRRARAARCDPPGAAARWGCRVSEREPRSREGEVPEGAPVDRAKKEELGDAALMFESVIRESPLAITVFDRDSRVMVWNPAAER